MNERAASQYGRRYQKLIRHILAHDRDSLSREDCEELEADCTMAALRAVADYCPGHSSGATLDSLVGRYILTARLCYLRRHARYDEISLDSPASLGDPNGPSMVENLTDDRPDDIDGDIEKERRIALVRELADGLPRGQRRALLGTLAGRSVPEIAHLAGISRAAVGEAYRHAVEAVRGEIERREHRQAAEKAYIDVMK